MNEQDKRNIQSVRLMYTGDAAERSKIAPDIVWHVPGHNPVSGDYHGFDEYTQEMPARMAPLSRLDFDLEDVMVNGNTVVATFDFHGERKNKRLIFEAHISCSSMITGKLLKAGALRTIKMRWMSFSRLK